MDNTSAPTASSNTPVTPPPVAIRTAPAPVPTDPPATSSPAANTGTEERRTPNAERQTLPENPQALLARLAGRWAELPRQALRDFQVALGTALTDSRPAGLVNGTLTIELPADFCAAHGDDAVMRTHLAGLVERIAGTRLAIVLRPRAVTGGDERGRRYQAATDHPLVRDLLTRFEADILAREVMTAEEWHKRLP